MIILNNIGFKDVRGKKLQEKITPQDYYVEADYVETDYVEPND